MIDIFTKESCVFCKILKEELQKSEISFNEKPIEKVANEKEFKTFGVEAYPLTKISSQDGVCLILGSQADKIKKVHFILNA